MFIMVIFDTLEDLSGLFDNESQVKYKLEDDQSCGITTGECPFVLPFKLKHPARLIQQNTKLLLQDISI